MTVPSRSRADVRSTYTVSYDSADHWSVLTQMWGSMWPTVLPYCIFNVVMMIVLIFLDCRYNARFNIEISSQGHTFLTLVVSFLLISRVNTAVSRYNQARGAIGTMYKDTRELMQNACIFSAHDASRSAQEWRNEVAYRVLLLLRVAMAVIDYPMTNVASWEIPELKGYELEQAKKCTYTTPESCRWSHEHRSDWEESMRVPLRMAYLLRSSIHSQGHIVKEPIALGLEIPFVMLQDDSGDFAHCFTVFLMTYGFVGLEVVAIELDNPFGDDANDFDNLAMAHTAFEDVYMTIHEIDGSEWTDKLRAKMYCKAEGELPTEKSWLLSTAV